MKPGDKSDPGRVLPASAPESAGSPAGTLSAWQQAAEDMRNKPKEVKRIGAFSLRDAAALQPPRWYVKDLIAEETITIIHAEPKSGKSYVMGHLALSLASGASDWLGMKIDFPEGGRVAWLDADMGHYHALRRLDQIANGIEDGYDPALFDRFFIFTPETYKQFGIGKFDLFAGTSIDELILFIEQNNVKLLFIDTLAQVRGASNENDAGDMTQVFNRLKEIRDKTGCSVVGVHHSKKDQIGNGKPTARGSSAIYAEPDTVLRLVKDKDDPCYLTLEVESARDFEPRKIGMYQTWPQRFGADGHALKDADGRGISGYKLEYSELTNRGGGSAAEDYRNLLAYIKANPGKNRTGIYAARNEHGVTNNAVLSERLAVMVDTDMVRFEKRGRGGAMYYYAVEKKEADANEQPRFY